MIAKITHGRSASQALAYDHGPGRADEHVNPHRVAGNIAGRDWRVRAHTMQRFVAAHQTTRQDRQQNIRARDGQSRAGKGERGVYRVALANPSTDRVLSDREWRQIADKFVARFSGRDGADMGPWEATRHDAHHIHLTISKYGYDGSRMSESHDYRRVAQICRELEAEHGLTNAAARSGRGSGRVRADKEHAARAASRGEPPRAAQRDRDWLRETVGEVLKDGGGIEDLRAAGVDVKLNQASTGRVSGISYSRARDEQDRQGDHGVHRDGGEQGEQIWFKGSQLGKAYSWNQVREHLEHQQRAPQTEDQHHDQPPRQQARADERTASDRAPDREESGRATDARGGPAGGRDDGGMDSGGGHSGDGGGGGGQQIRDPGGPWMPPGEIGPPAMTRQDRKAAALEQARARQAERERRREQSRDEQGRDH
ncbi:relaxase/mobilization nuclease domain-containing protein [Mycobacteroides abscessus]|uniref:relaxase/mobilization nuclease domain-containing protein n=1 Tax=Mycobacteroides abscessus TaxID=36809 RepID=UPI003AAF5984